MQAAENVMNLSEKEATRHSEFAARFGIRQASDWRSRQGNTSRISA